MKARIKDYVLALGRKFIVTLECDAPVDEKLMQKELDVSLKLYSKKRSTRANAYLWELCDKIAEKLSTDKVIYTKEDIYRETIKESGVWRDDEVSPEDVQWRCTAWGLIGKGWLTERVDFSQDGNKEIIRFYYGSSQYNTRQMSRIIDNVVQDCKALGIETMTPDEIANMLSLMEAGEKRG